MLKAKNQLLDAVLSNSPDVEDHFRFFTKAPVRVVSNFHKRALVKRYFVLDVDSLDDEFVGRVLDLFTEKTGVEPLLIIRTHGGYHFIYDRWVKPETEFARSLGKKGGNLITIAHKLFVEEWTSTRVKLGGNGEDIVEVKTRSPMSPVPGTYQGGVKVKTVKL
jgi:hypothetical protein